MPKYFGNIGFLEKTDESRPGFVRETIVPKKYYGDVQKISRRLQYGDKINDDMQLANSISIIMDPYLNENLYNIRYLEFMGIKWKISSIEIQCPRVVLTLGGIYNADD